MSRIFISYRREDSAPYAGRLYGRLSQRFGEEQVFMDIDTIKPGVDFVEVVEAAVGSCDAVVVVIGKQWLTVTGYDGKRRLDHPEDFVRLEVSAALKRKVRTIPVLVEGATMPRSNELPDDLVHLARRNALEISDSRWAFDVGQLVRTLEDVLGEPGLASSPAAVGTRVYPVGRDDAAVMHAEPWPGQEREGEDARDVARTTVLLDPSPMVRSGWTRLRWMILAVGLLLLATLVGLRLRAMTGNRPASAQPTPLAATVAEISTPASGAAEPADTVIDDRPSSAFPITIGDTVAEGAPGPGAGMIETPGAKDVYTFTADAGQTVFFQVKEANPSSIHWTVTDETETVIFDTCLCGNAGAFRLSRGGQYTITVGSDTDSQLGTYQFRLWDVQPPDKFEIAIGDTVAEGAPGPGAGMIETPGAKDVYTFTADAGQTVFFQVKEANPSSIHWTVTDETETVIFDTCLCGNAGAFRLSRGGQYTITVGSDTDSQPGTYQFRLWDVQPPDKFEIAIGDTVAEGAPGPGAGMIETPGAKDVYTFTADAGQTVFFQVKEANPSSIHWTVTDELDTVVFDTCLCGDAGAFRLSRGGQYTVTVGSDTESQLGTYQFRIYVP